MSLNLRLLLLLVALGTTACSTMWPEYEKPQIEVPAAPIKPLSLDRQWWKVFGDPVLDRLVAEALENNKDLAKAAAAVDEALANAKSARALLFPRVDGAAKLGSTKRQLTFGQAGDFEKITSTGSIGAGVSWEIDLWDRIRQTNDAALARYAASEHTRNATSLSISSVVAETWFQLRVLDAKLGITRDAAVNLKTVSNLEYRRWKADVGTELAYRQSLAEFAATEARIPSIEAAVAKTELALQLLVGRSPRAMAQTLQRGADLQVPDTPKEVDPILLLRRPDVASAELLLVAAHADVNSARAENYPRLTLSLLAGFIVSTSKVISGMPLFWDASAGLTGPIFDAGLVQSKVDGAEARKQKALAHYQYTVSVAFRDAYEALVLLDTSDREVKSVEDEVKTRKQSMVLSEKSYDAGRSSKFEVLAETVKVLNAELSLADARLSQLTARSQYFKALGGGF
jgi:multidrug efflux system outer membrane protein